MLTRSISVPKKVFEQSPHLYEEIEDNKKDLRETIKKISLGSSPGGAPGLLMALRVTGERGGGEDLVV